MAFENIRLKYSNFTVKDGYFFTFVHDNDMLFKKNTEGDVVFTYPLDTALDSSVFYTCCDGINFWTLQRPGTDEYRIIKKWRIEGFICKLIRTYTFGDTENLYDVDAFSIEDFCSTLSTDLPVGSAYITLPTSFIYDIPVGTIVTIGPDENGFYEEVTVTGTLSDNKFGLDFYTTLPHSENEDLSFVKNFWLFNNYTGTLVSPSLVRYNLAADILDYSLESDAFNNVTGCTFYIDDEHTSYLLYVYGTVLRFFNIVTKEVDKSFTMDNIRINGTTVIPVYGLEVEGDTVYRLQKYMKYFETDHSQSTYNYQCSTLRSFVDSISMEVYPKILPSNGVSTSEVTTVIQDQYGDPARYKVAHVSDDDSTGYMTIEKPMTDLQGVARTYYRAGLSVREVTITSLATQYD